MNKTSLIIPAFALLLGGCATPYVPTLATPDFNPANIVGFSVDTPRQVEITDGRQAWKVHLVGRCLEVVQAKALVFTDEQSLRQWPNQPWRQGYGTVVGWPIDGQYPDRSSGHMRVSSNRLSWVHAYDGQGKPLKPHASQGCQVEEVEPLWR
jgi:hypothetical protein